jgi:foldase protein PrsA
MKKTRLISLLLGGALMVSSVTGCGGINKNAAVATLDGETITLGVANFAARLQQASYDDFYVAYFGEDVWQTSYGTDTMENMTKDDVIDSVKTMYILQKHMEDYDVTISDDEQAAIKEAAETFIADNTEKALKALGADEDIVEEYLTLRTVQNKMYNAIIAEADTDVSDEEANTSAYSYVSVSNTTYTDDDGNSAEYTDDELSQLTKTLGLFVTEAKTGTLEDAADTYGYTVETGTFTADDDSIDEALYEALSKLDEGEITGVVEGEDNYYIARLDAVTDEDATESTRESIISQRQSDHYDEVLEGYEDEHEWVLNEKTWAKVTFSNLFTTVAPSTETEEAETEDDTVEVEDVEATEAAEVETVEATEVE